MNDELIEQVARAIWEQQCQHWGHYRDQIPDLCTWDELTQSKQRELMREALAAIAAMEPHIAAEREDAARRALEAAATVPPGKATSNGCETIGQWTRRTLREAIRAIDPAQFREAGNGG